MKTRFWLKMIAGALALAALLATPGLPVPGAERLGLGGAALAQENIDIDTFYDELEPYGQWVWHPRFGYVWLPEDVSPDWRPYTVGHWVSTEEYGWYWESNEPFAWAVYHYGRWGYDPDYGWFWVPGDTWAPAWVQWRYDDQYVGWAPIGPQRAGYAYGAPVGYEPPIAESWVFVPPQYMTSRAIPHYAVPIADLGVVFLGATRVYRPQFRGGVVYNYGVPRDYVVRITRRPIYVQKIYKVDTWKGGRYDKNHHGNGIRVYAPGVHKGDGHRGPKKFADHPDQFKPKAKLKHTFKGEPPKGFGRSAKDVKSIAKQDPDAFKRKHGRFDQGDNDKDGGNDNDKNKGQANRDKFQNGGKDNVFDKNSDKDKNKGQANRDKFQNGGKDNVFDNNSDKDKNKGQANKDHDHDRKNGKEKFGTAPAPKLPPPIVKGGTGDATSGKTKNNKNNGFGNGDIRTQTEQGTIRQHDNNDNAKNKNKNKNQNFGGQNGQGGNQAKAFDQGGQGGDNRHKNKDRDKGDRGNKSNNNNKNFGGGGGGGGGQQVQRNQGGGGGGGNNGNNNNKKDKCQKHPEKPECQ
jgi:Family of unknown function (DUF6600)